MSAFRHVLSNQEHCLDRWDHATRKNLIPFKLMFEFKQKPFELIFLKKIPPRIRMRHNGCHPPQEGGGGELTYQLQLRNDGSPPRSDSKRDAGECKTGELTLAFEIALCEMRGKPFMVT